MNNTFGDLVHTKRNQLGYSMRELARRTNVDVAYISKIEKGQALNPNFSVVMRISKELSINIETLQRVFELNEDITTVINGAIQKRVPEEEKETVQGIVGELVQITDNQEFDIKRLGEVLQKIYSLHKMKNTAKEMFYVITVEDKEWIHVLETPVVDSQLIDLYYQAFELSESHSMIVKGEIVTFPDYFNESQLRTIQSLKDMCTGIKEEDERYLTFIELKEYLEKMTIG
ncbi:helix-turn-helix domain-containing protein [Fictibacillus iocasae]|uniref:Helix-turn-helix domain-containing protein n=1 Tax=Fictibacillus iocasae TaxID=2715437 RepID=A0ABW2NN97_9BACL